LWTVVYEHRRWLDESGEGERRRRRRATAELRSILAVQLAARAARLGAGARFDGLRDQVLTREVDPWTAVDELLPPS
jgi:LAO/AO transport system kinase